MDTFDLKSPDQIKKELDETAEQLAKISYTYRRLEEHKKIIEAQKALRSLGISGTTSDTLRSILKDFKVESWLDDASKTLRRT